MRIVTIVALVAGLLVIEPRVSAAFSVLAHQAVVDGCWETSIVPAIRRRYPNVNAKDLERARAFVHGGSHIPDLGYFPFGNRLFTDLLHYVRSGEFVAALVGSARTPEEYAFALGVLSHYLTDDTGHPDATNPTVAEIYPKLRRKLGDSVTYAENPPAHLQTEFRFDVLQVSRSKQSPDLFKHAIAFQVSEPLLDRAFVETYGLHLDDLFESTAVAITTYRWAFREAIHEATGISWELYRADIQRLDPTMTPAKFVSDLSRADFEKEFGKTYRQPGYFAKFFALLVKLVPNAGPLERMPYKALPPDARERFAAALDRAGRRYRTAVARLPGHHLRLANENLDIGRPTRSGEYAPADEAYASLLLKLGEHDFAGTPPGLRADVFRFFAAAPVARNPDGSRARELRDALARLDEMPLGRIERVGGRRQR
ncbi:MAG TPA: zinc dependent phospholipase C family protein [Thermoanaerobaculia bacterium]|nr:zinc dependent phospholipase C family protein [Thermoanaerobaculia bacterium]